MSAQKAQAVLQHPHPDVPNFGPLHPRTPQQRRTLTLGELMDLLIMKAAGSA